MRKRVLTPKLSTELRKNSPLKQGLVVKNEDDTHQDYNKIISRLYLGNKKTAKSKSFMKKHNIKAIVNCSKKRDIDNYFKNSDIEYFRVSVDDSLLQKDFDKMLLLIPSAVEFVHKHVDILAEPCLVHCYAGRQRSACILVCYLMKYHNFKPLDACKFVLQKRNEAFHFGLSVNFDQTINAYYKQLQKCLD